MGNDAAAEDVVRTAARAGEPDRYVAALLAPRRARADLIALAAFLSEASRAVAVASEPMIGEIRLQWWRDAIAAGEMTGSPVADAMLRTIAEHALPRDLVLSILDGKSLELAPEPASSLQKIISDHVDVERAAFQLAACILGVEKTPAADAAIAAAAESYGRIRLLRSLPYTRHTSPLTVTAGVDVPTDWASAAGPIIADARDWFARSRERITLSPGVLPAILPIALIEPYLRALEGAGPNISRERAEISPITRAWRLWLAHARGRP
jgi:15-cis-phytoene synthase